MAKRPRMSHQEFTNVLRTEEIQRVLRRHAGIFSGKTLLEIGSGAGAQLLQLQRVCLSATGLEVSSGPPPSRRLAPIGEYDGSHIPFPGASFDVIFSSNVLEHVRDEKTLHAEMHRVLRPGGVSVHVVPTAAWRVWASLSHYPAILQNIWRKSVNAAGLQRTSAAKTEQREPVTLSRWRARLSYALIQRRHGESGNWLTEHFLFRTGAWKKRLEGFGWRIEAVEPVGLAHSGYCLLGERLSWNTRARLAKVAGSATVLFIARSSAC